jgi:hypothetical protein
MAFPLNPTNGQQATVNGLLYSYSSTIGAWTVATQAQSISLTVASIGASGNVSGSSGLFTNVSGNGAALTAINASNVASGTLAAARLSGTYTITVSGSATTAGTVTTAAQPNITSVGTLTSLSVTGNATSGGRISASGTGGFASSTYAAGARNPIWRFGDADGYGISYFQGSAGIGGSDTIGFHFGTATAAASFLQLNQPGTAVFSASVNPSASNTYDLGTASLRWRNIYTQDLHLNNGIGDWTIVEGEDDLFLYNNKRNKVYKFNLTEIDPEQATPKINELNKKS